MPTSFTTVSNGQTIEASHINELHAPINTLETTVAGLSGFTNASTAFSSGQVPLARGGTGADLSATGGSSQFLKQTSAGGNISVGGILANDLPASIDCAKFANGSVSNAEFQYLDGVTSGIQAQIDGKAASSHNHAASAITSGQLALARGGTGADLSATGGSGQVLKQNSAGGAITVGALTYADVGAAAASHTHAASDIASGTLAVARGGTGLGTLGTAGQVLQVNAGATGLEFGTPSATDSTKLPLAGGVVSGDILNSAAIRIGPNTSDGADNSLITLGHSGITRGGRIEVPGNEHASVGRIKLIPGAVGGNCRVEIMGIDGTSVLFYVDGYTGGVYSTYALNAGNGIACTGALTFSGTSSPTMGMGRDGIGNLTVVSTWALTITAPGGTSHGYPLNVSTGAAVVANTTFTTVKAMPNGPCLTDVFVAGLGAATLFWDGTTLSVWQSLADASIVAAASAGSGEVAWRVSSGNLQASNNTGSSKNCYAGLSRR